MREYAEPRSGLFDRAVATVLPAVPRAVVQRVSAPYIAGPTLDDAIRTVASLNARESAPRSTCSARRSTGAEEARAIAAAYGDALAAIETAVSTRTSRSS